MLMANGSPAAASNATSIIPLIVGYNGLFLITYAHLADKSFLTGISAALGVWFFLTITTLKLGMNSFALSLILYGFIFLFLVLRLRRKIIVDALPNKIIRFTAAQIGMRFIFSGSIIAIAIYLSKKSGPIIGGVMSVFPIVFISTIIIAYLSAGKKFSISLTNSMMVSSMVNLVAYAVCVRFFYLWWGIALGTYISILVSMGTAFAVHFALRRLLKKIKAIQPAAGSTG